MTQETQKDPQSMMDTRKLKPSHGLAVTSTEDGITREIECCKFEDGYGFRFTTLYPDDETPLVSQILLSTQAFFLLVQVAVEAFNNMDNYPLNPANAGDE